MRRRTFLEAGLAGACSSAASAGVVQVPSAPLPDEMTRGWAAGADRSRLAGIAISIVRTGQPDIFWSHGYAELPFRTPITRQTLFPIGSTSKHVTAIGVLRLTEAGVIGLDDPITRHLKDAPATWAPITIRHLLTHTSGLANNWDFFPDFDRPHPRSELIKRIGAEPLAFPPGSAWAYTSLNYDILGWVIGDLAGMPFAAFMQNRVFDPAGLPHARIDAADEIIPMRAEGYNVEDDRIHHSAREAHDLSASGAGGVLFSGADIPPWDRALASNTLISKQSTQASLSPVMLSTGRAFPYGFGWYFGQTRGNVFHWHGGSEPGYIAQYVCYPSLGLSVFSAINSFIYSDMDPAIEAIRVQVAEHFSPGSTWLSLPDGPPAEGRRGAVLRRMLSGQILDPEALAPEAQKRKAYEHNSFGQTLKSPLVSLNEVERYGYQGVTAIRYRAVTASSTSHFVAGWTPDDRLVWVSAV